MNLRNNRVLRLLAERSRVEWGVSRTENLTLWTSLM